MKKGYLVLLILLLCGVAVGCGSQNSEKLRVLSSDWKEEIEEAWLEKTGEKIRWYDEKVKHSWLGSCWYYGSYQDAIVFFNNCGMALEIYSQVTVAGEIFEWSRGFSIDVYKEGEFYSLAEAYDLGVLSEKNVKAISEYHDWFLATQTDWNDNAGTE